MPLNGNIYVLVKWNERWKVKWDPVDIISFCSDRERRYIELQWITFHWLERWNLSEVADRTDTLFTFLLDEKQRNAIRISRRISWKARNGTRGYKNAIETLEKKACDNLFDSLALLRLSFEVTVESRHWIMISRYQVKDSSVTASQSRSIYSSILSSFLH